MSFCSQADGWVVTSVGHHGWVRTTPGVVRPLGCWVGRADSWVVIRSERLERVIGNTGYG